MQVNEEDIAKAAAGNGGQVASPPPALEGTADVQMEMSRGAKKSEAEPKAKGKPNKGSGRVNRSSGRQTTQRQGDPVHSHCEEMQCI